jgi:hypothetical protein
MIVEPGLLLTDLERTNADKATIAAQSDIAFALVFKRCDLVDQANAAVQ